MSSGLLLSDFPASFRDRMQEASISHKSTQALTVHSTAALPPVQQHCRAVGPHCQSQVLAPACTAVIQLHKLRFVLNKFSPCIRRSLTVGWFSALYCD